MAPLVFSELGAEVIRVGTDPNGTNINDGVGSLYPEKLKKAVKEARADVGFALDGDADRLVVCDDKGNVLVGDALLAMCALDLKSRHQLPQNTMVTTVMSNIGLDQSGQRRHQRGAHAGGRSLCGGSHEKSPILVVNPLDIDFLDHATGR